MKANGSLKPAMSRPIPWHASFPFGNQLDNEFRSNSTLALPTLVPWYLWHFGLEIFIRFFAHAWPRRIRVLLVPRLYSVYFGLGAIPPSTHLRRWRFRKLSAHVASEHGASQNVDHDDDPIAYKGFPL